MSMILGGDDEPLKETTYTLHPDEIKKLRELLKKQDQEPKSDWDYPPIGAPYHD